jgi:hypothetical protein
MIIYVFSKTALMIAAKSLLIHTDTLFESIINDGFFGAILILLLFGIGVLGYKYYKKKN